jgi:hypothetical protein
MNMISRANGMVIVALIGLALSARAAGAEDADAPAAPAAGFLIPHIIESLGRAASTPNSLDTTIFITDLSALRGAPIPYAVELVLLDKAGAALRVEGQEVCNPCIFELGGDNPMQRTIAVEELLAAAGRPGAVTVATAVVRPIGAAVEDVDVAAVTVNAKTGALDLDVSWIPVRRLATGNDDDRPCHHRHGRSRARPDAARR